MRAVREGLAQAVADEIADLLAGAEPLPGAEPLRASEIFVLTRTWVEAKAVAGALAARGVPAVLYNQEGLYATPEARQVRDLLRAIADPHDPGQAPARLADAVLRALAGGSPGGRRRRGRSAALRSSARLARGRRRASRSAASSRASSTRAASSRRELFLGESARRLTNFQHLFEVLAAEAARAARPLGDVVRRLSALCAKLVVPEPEEGNVQRLEGDRDAVQIMTMHKAKGLEADVVFLYGGFSPSPNKGRSHYTEPASRVAIGRPSPDQRARRPHQARARRRGPAALLRGAHARPAAALPAVLRGSARERGALRRRGRREDHWKLTGGYRHVNRRLRALRADEAQRRHFETRDVPIDPRGAGDGGRPRSPRWASSAGARR